MHAGGFSAASIFPADVARAEAAGASRAELRRVFDDAGIRIAVVEPLTTWLPSWTPGPDITPEEIAFASFSEEDVFSMADVLGAEVVSLNEFFGEVVDVKVAARSMAELCDRAAERGFRIALEPMPFSGVSDLATAWEIVRGADRANAGLVLDSWHFFRKGPDLELLRSIPAEHVFAVQLNDAPRLPDGPAKDESMHRRLLAGDGELPLGEFIAAIPAPWDGRLVGPEIFSDEAWKLPPEELGRRLGDTVREVLSGRG